jgi:hypothetical protein
MLLLASAVWLAGQAMDRAWASPCRVGLWLLWLALLWIGGVITAAEKQTVLAMGRQIGAYSRRVIGRVGVRTANLPIRR